MGSTEVVLTGLEGWESQETYPPGFSACRNQVPTASLSFIHLQIHHLFIHSGTPSLEEELAHLAVPGKSRGVAMGLRVCSPRSSGFFPLHPLHFSAHCYPEVCDLLD
jgi:hypothetical protein